ncbi:MAG: cytochrome c [Polaribacter sp.]
MKKFIYKSIFISVISFGFYNCSTTVIPLEEEPAPVLEMVKYNNNVKSIIDANCISCHASGGQASFLPLINYSQVKNAAESGNLISRMNNITNPMPQSGLLPAQTRAIIDKWKTDGFLEN